MEVVTALVAIWQYKEGNRWYFMLEDIALQYERAYRSYCHEGGPSVAFIRIDDYARYEADLEEMFQRRQQWRANEDHFQRDYRSTPYKVDTQASSAWVEVKCREIRRQIKECPLLD